MSARRGRARGATRALTLVVLGLVAAVVLGPPVSAADLSATLGEVSFHDQQVETVLTVRGDTGGFTVDAGSLSATVGDQPTSAQPSAEPVTGVRRTMIVVDTSGSMSPSDMAAVRASVGQFLATVPADVEIGVVSFSNEARVDLPLTKDRGQVQGTVDALTPGGNTALYAAVNLAAAQLGAAGERSIMLLSDGGETVNTSEGAQRSAVDALQHGGIRAEIVAFNTQDSQESILATFAAAGGGSVIRASDQAGLTAAFTKAANALRSQLLVRVRPQPGLTGSQRVVIKGYAGGSPFSASGTVDLGAGIPRPSATPSTVASASPGGVIAARAPTGWNSVVPGTSIRWSLALPLLILFLGFLGLSVGLAAPALGTARARRVEMIDFFTRGAPAATKAARQRANPSAVSEQLVAMGTRVMEGRESTSRTMQLIERADLPWRAGEWFVLRCVAVVAFGAVGYLLLPGSRWLGLVLGGVVGFFFPALFLRFLAKRRAGKFESLLPDVLMLVATSLSSGFSLPQAFDAVARDAAEPAAREFSRALAETRIGADLSDALDRMAVRMDSENLRWTVMAIRIQRDVGGNLGDTLRTTAKTLRERESLRRQVKALSAEGRLSAYILIALPIGIFFYSMLVNYEYVSLLWRHPLGLVMSVGGIVMMVLGIFWMRNVVKIEV